MKIIDKAAGVSVVRHAQELVVAARVDELQFYESIHAADIVTCVAHLNPITDKERKSIV